MSKQLKYSGFIALLLAGNPVQPLLAEVGAIDYSCMRVQVRPIIQVTDRYKEYDIVVRNRCPGDVYWSMCIERMNPWSHKVVEPHYPSGMVEAEKKARVNLQMKNTPNKAGDQARFQEFYVDVAFGLQPPVKAVCKARSCEAKKTDVRSRVSANDKAWQKALKAAEQSIEGACPDNGWNTKETQKCREDQRLAISEKMAPFEEQDTALRAAMAALAPANCPLHGGDTVATD